MSSGQQESIAYKLLVDFNFCDRPLNKYEEWWKIDNTTYLVLANPVASMSILVKYDPKKS